MIWAWGHSELAGSLSSTDYPHMSRPEQKGLSIIICISQKQKPFSFQHNSSAKDKWAIMAVEECSISNKLLLIANKPWNFLNILHYNIHVVYVYYQCTHNGLKWQEIGIVPCNWLDFHWYRYSISISHFLHINI